nr:ABC transporter permease [Thaumasiovibrio subtropicus]
MRLLPGDIAYRIAAGRYGYDYVDQAAKLAVEAELGLDRPAFQLYWQWLLDLVQGDLGRSLVSDAPVIGEIYHQLGHTVMLAIAATLVSLLIALPIGVYCGKRAGSKRDQFGLFFSVLLRAQPVFVIGLLMIILFAIHLRVLPVAGFGSSEYIVLPAVTLAFGLAAMSNRVIRNATQRALTSGYYLFARLKGLSETQAFEHHAQRNIAIPVVAFVGIQAVGLVEGIVMIESLFSWPGIGHALAHAIFQRDIPMIQGTALIMGLLFVAINTLVDLAGYALDPRQRRGHSTKTEEISS